MILQFSVAIYHLAKCLHTVRNMQVHSSSTIIFYG